MKKWVVSVIVLCAIGSCGAGTAGLGTSKNGAVAELWSEPADLATRDLFHGPGGTELVPRSDAQYELLDRDTSGYSITFDLKDERAQEWSVKIGPEAQSEVVAARLVWAMGYHQPPSYYVPKWTYRNASIAPVHGRFRPKLPWLKQTGSWDWKRNPFAGTQALQGLKVLMMVLNSTDLKALNNAVYQIERPDAAVPRWFVVKDLGATLGETGVMNPRRGWIDGFEKHGFIDGIDEDGTVKFEFKGRHADMLDDVKSADVRWMCERLDRLSDRQWRDAFRAGGYDGPTSERFIARIRQKIDRGTSLQ